MISETSIEYSREDLHDNCTRLFKINIGVNKQGRPIIYG